MPPPGYVHGPLQMFGPENGVCNYLALEKIYGTLILWFVCCLLQSHLTKREGGGGSYRHPRTLHQLHPCLGSSFTLITPACDILALWIPIITRRLLLDPENHSLIE